MNIEEINKKRGIGLRTDIICVIVIGTILMMAQIGAAITARDLGILNNAERSYPLDINDIGQIVGYSTLNGYPNATYWNISSVNVIDLGPLRANGVNNFGQAVGDTSSSYGALWDLSSLTKTNLEMPTGYTQASARSINIQSKVVGSVFDPDTLSVRALLWDTSAETYKELDPLPGNYGSHAEDINDNNQVVGASANLINYLTVPNATYWNISSDPITPVNLVALPGMTQGFANAINNEGKVVGYSKSADNTQTYATLWDINTETITISELRPLSGAINCIGNDINDMNQIVGTCWTGQNPSIEIAVLWNIAGDPTLMGSDSEVFAINNLGQAVGYRWTTDGTKTIPRLWNISGTTSTTPSEEIQQIISGISDLVNSGKLNKGEGNSLQVKLQAANNKIDKDNKAAINELKAFINEIQALINSGRLISTDGQNLIDMAEDIITKIG